MTVGTTCGGTAGVGAEGVILTVGATGDQAGVATGDTGAAGTGVGVTASGAAGANVTSVATGETAGLAKAGISGTAV